MMLGALGLYTILSYVFPQLERHFAYRIFALGTLGACLLAVGATRLRRRWGGVSWRQRPELKLWVTSGFLGLVAAYIVLTFALPGLLHAVSIRILTLTAIVVTLLCHFAIERIAGREDLSSAVGATEAKSDSLARRFFTSLGVFLLLPLYMVLLLVYPPLQSLVETKIVMFGIVAAALVGFWSVSRDILELLRILRKAKLIASKEVQGLIDTSKKGEIRELASAFNVVVSERDNTITRLQAAKQRVESLVDRIGKAISVSGSMDELLNIVLETATEALGAGRGFLRIMQPDSPGARLVMSSTAEDRDLAGVDKVNRKLDRVAENGTYIYEPAFLAVPLTRRGQRLGVLALQKTDRDDPFDFRATELLQNIANQAALAIEASLLRESEERVYFETISALALAVEAKDRYTRGHSQRVSAMAVAIARELSLSEQDVEIVRDSALLHDIGKIGIPDNVLGKPGPLSETEYDTVRQHPVTGRHILMPLGSLRRLQNPVRHHHERPDGRGYPEGLQGAQIDKKSAILSVADSLDAMLSDRPYRKAYGLEHAIGEIESGAGAQFDREVVSAVLRLIERGWVPGHGKSRLSDAS